MSKQVLGSYHGAKQHVSHLFFMSGNVFVRSEGPLVRHVSSVPSTTMRVSLLHNSDKHGEKKSSPTPNVHAFSPKLLNETDKHEGGCLHLLYRIVPCCCSKRQQRHVASIWAIMVRFGYMQIQEELNGPKVHRLENVLALLAELHRSFDGMGRLKGQ
ncbi:hypothetical protein HD554DRAFT_59621 [Boletus coccyginus]|nr:hypothetical protein HD554DRAFT_59621 [Boletus coccyginus]